MSGWLEAVREVYSAGGKTTAGQMVAPLDDIKIARAKGFLMPGLKGKGPHAVEITQRGIDLIEGRVTMRTPRVPSTNGGRAPGTHKRMVATWLMALPRTNEVRL